MNIKITEPICIFSHLGVYKGRLFIEPGKSYHIVLPDKMNKTQADKLNPYYDETEFQFGILNTSGDELNFLIRAFDDAYIPYFNKLTFNVYTKTKPEEFDNTITEMEAPFKDIKNVFFNQYKNYKIGLLKLLAFQHKSKAIANMYFLNKPVLYNNPGYMDLFNQMYGTYFLYSGKTNTVKNILSDINDSASLRLLKLILSEDSILSNDTLKEFVILKNLYDNFYSDKFSRASLLKILDTFINSATIQNNKETALGIRKKVTKLMIGYEPPDFELFDKNNKLVKRSDFKGKFVYIMFCSCTSYSCMNEFELLDKLYKSYHDSLEIISIVADDDMNAMQDFLTKNKYGWTFLHYGNQPDIISDYNIRGFPVYYFLDRNGKLISSPAVSPSEHFEMYLLKALRERKK